MTSLIRSILTYWIDGGVLLLPIAAIAIMIFYQLQRLSRDFRYALSEAVEIEHQLGFGPGPRKATQPEFTPCAATATTILGIPVPDATASDASATPTRRQIETAMRTRRARLDERIRVLAALTAAAPLLGLLGTVSGMTATFAGAAGIGSDPARQVAGGIGVALTTTQYGLMTALPGVFGLVHIRRLRDRLVQSDGAIRMLVCRSPAREATHV